MPEPEVVRIVREFKDALALREAAQMNEMALRWLQVESALSGQISALAQEVNAIRAAGGTVPHTKLLEMDRYQELLREARWEMQAYTEYANGAIAAAQREWGTLGRQMAIEAIESAYGAGVAANFARLPTEAIEAMVGLLGDGTPLSRLLAEAYPDAAQGLTDKLLEAIAKGMNPRDTAKEMFDGMSDGLNRLLTIARTEQNRAFREAAYLQYKHSGVVEGFYRLADHSGNVCAACLFAEGEFYDMDSGDRLDDHPNGRCSMVPKVKGFDAPDFEKGIDWFGNQDEDMQRQILGDGRYDAWQEGKFDLADVVVRTHDDTWGGSLGVKSLDALLGE
jgi:hypothetical protein